MTKLTSSNGLVTFHVPSANPKPKAKKKPKDGSAGPKGLQDMFKLL